MVEAEQQVGWGEGVGLSTMLVERTVSVCMSLASCGRTVTRANSCDQLIFVGRVFAVCCVIVHQGLCLLPFLSHRVRTAV